MCSCDLLLNLTMLKSYKMYNTKLTLRLSSSKIYIHVFHLIKSFLDIFYRNLFLQFISYQITIVQSNHSRISSYLIITAIGVCSCT